MEIQNDLRSSLRADEDIVKNCVVLEPNCHADYVELLVSIDEDGGHQTILGIIEIQLWESHEVRFVRTQLLGTQDGSKLVTETEEQTSHECDSVEEIVDQVASIVSDAGHLPDVMSLTDFVSVLSYCGARVVTAMPSVINDGLLLEAHVDRGWVKSFDLLADQIEFVELEKKYPFDLLASPDLSPTLGNEVLYSQVETPSLQPVLPSEGVDAFADQFQGVLEEPSEEPNFPSLREMLTEKRAFGNTVSQGVCEDAISSLGENMVIALASDPKPNYQRTGVASDNWLLLSLHGDSILVQYLPSQDGFFFELDDEYRFKDAFDLVNASVKAGFTLHQGKEALKRLQRKVSGRDVGAIDWLLTEQPAGENYEQV